MTNAPRPRRTLSLGWEITIDCAAAIAMGTLFAVNEMPAPVTWLVPAGCLAISVPLAIKRHRSRSAD